ncbi:non-classical arabinogalactan protein 30 [Oryza sativa Japonica Group]|uniref:Os01g0164075 protein n=2 Tax=Oryza sativa subsp. japonica TaxID=39947 RepID=A2ZPL3_ORYSJ|nr:non-classical arabinogalactan protein 30 [Oryza sativa Japonica Group]EAZ10660.1 hypothetical protein OsJ_00490 [Oryza sativa Japonica Group]BAS70551.1 Os01g0164075 [Oryza sativa Japonica Group]
MVAFLPLAILVSLLAAGATANNGYTTPSPPPPPAHSDKLLVRVEGMVYCQSCAYRNTHSLNGAMPLPKAEVSVTCHDTKNRVMECKRAIADESGYFQTELGVTKVSDFFMGDPSKACHVRLQASPDFKCNNPTNINYSDIKGAPLRDEGKRWTGQGYDNVVYAAGPLAFRPAICPPKH